jgi:hypothetical protein
VRFISQKLGISPRTVYRYKDFEESRHPGRPTRRGRASSIPTCPIC